MFDQLIIGAKSSYDDFDASVKERHISPPKKKSIKETVPFSNKTYDFSAINGEVYWEERELEYVFEIIADTPGELEQKKAAFRNWIMNVMDAEIHDPFITNYHFKGTFAELDEDDDETVEKCTITVVFGAYPYMIANEKKVYKQTLSASGKATINAVNNSSHRLLPTITLDSACSITFNGITYTILAGTYTGDAMWLVIGDNVFELSNPSTSVSCTVEISFYEEVF